jgi:dihydroneopterin aldolase
MGTVFVRGLSIQTIVGIHPAERTTPQQVLISFELVTDTGKAAASDNIADAVDYDGASQRISELVIARQFQLLETMAEEIAALLLAAYPLSAVAVEVQKPAALSNANSVGVRIERTASD